MAENQNINQTDSAEESVLTQAQLSEQMLVRREKLKELCEQGNNPYELVKYPDDH